HDRIVSLHIKDRDKDGEHAQRKFGEGGVPIIESMKLIKKLKFKYAANIEYEPEPQNPTASVRDAFEYLKRWLS
ncbi:MAG TPA: sugar phosphate isomerase/epimerase, partial [Blastocatellia bacterium]|nr:sugar phosphate isomerase/epimerase [Blastocatellia bacterium]